MNASQIERSQIVHADIKGYFHTATLRAFVELAEFCPELWRYSMRDGQGKYTEDEVIADLKDQRLRIIGKFQRENPNAERNERMARLRDQGWRIERIAEHVGMSFGSISIILKKHQRIALPEDEDA